MKNPTQKIIPSGIYNILRSAPTRSGKGVSSVIPMRLLYPTEDAYSDDPIADLLTTPTSVFHVKTKL